MIDIDIASRMGRQQLEILSILSKSDGRFMTTGEIIEKLWGTWSEPDYASSAIKVQVSRIRKIMGDDIIETRPSRSGGGYRLVNAPKSMLHMSHD